MTTNKNKTWQEIEEEFKKQFVRLEDVTKFNDERCSYDYVMSKRDYKILAFFKPYFQEKLHEEAKEELEMSESSWENDLSVLIPENEDLLLGVRSDRICCSRQAIVNFISKVEKEAYERGWSDILVDVEKYTYQGDDEATARCFYRIKQEIIKTLKK